MYMNVVEFTRIDHAVDHAVDFAERRRAGCGRRRCAPPFCQLGELDDYIVYYLVDALR